MSESWQREAEDRADERQRIDDLAHEYCEDDFQELLKDPERIQELIEDLEPPSFWIELSSLLMEYPKESERLLKSLKLFHYQHTFVRHLSNARESALPDTWADDLLATVSGPEEIPF